MVTGATSGIGLVTVRELARFGATVFIVGRNPDHCRHAVEAIHLETRNPSVDFFCADLSSQAEVRGLAKAFLARHSRLHVLINNAGALFELRRESVDGIEMTLALNHLGPFLLTTLLLDVLKAAVPARIVNIASSAHADVEQCNFDAAHAASRRWFRRYPETESASLFNSLAMTWAHPAFLHYAHSKLANVLFTTELAHRLAGTGVTANALHPGIVASNFSAGNGAYGWFMNRYMCLRGVSVEAGAATSIYLAASPEIETVSGGYFVDKRIAPCPAAKDTVAAATLWQFSEQLTQRQAA